MIKSTTKFKNSDALKAYLKRQSQLTNISIEHCYSHFFGRNFLEKVSLFEYSDLMLKGSFVQYVHLGRMTRPTTDIDFVSLGYHREPVQLIFDVTDKDFGDKIKYYIKDKPKVTSTGIIKLKIWAAFDQINQPIGIDLASKSNNTYEHQSKIMPCLFEYDEPYPINTPSHEEHLAEKVCIVAESKKRDILNTRIKDFYDIYELHGGEYNRKKFAKYFEMSIIDRGKIPIDELSADHLNNDFIIQHQHLWGPLSKKYEFLDKSVTFPQAVFYSQAVLAEQVQNVKEKQKNITIIYWEE